jgi:two-component system, NtrC family, response regulator HydG
MSNVLCIDSEVAAGVVLEDALTKIGHQTVLAHTVDDAMRLLNQQPFDLVISDYHMPDATGLDLLDQLRQEGHDIPVIITTGYASVEDAVLAIRRGAIDYLTKPFRFESLRISVNNALEVCRLRRENESFQRELSSLRSGRSIIGESPALRQVMDTIAVVAPTRATVLLEGESGTGKELFARAIHEISPRASQPIVTVNCAALPEGLVESTLFGHERGAFTGATSRAAGAFERAHTGTLLLDEISEMRLDLQSKLLRAIQEQEFERVGGSQPIKVDVRIVATTNRNLAVEVEAGRFRRDLFYRLSVVPIRTPPLRERLEDLPLLVRHFVDQVAKELGVRPPHVPPETIDFLRRRPWTGNIRELANAVERAVILSRNGSLAPDCFGLDPLAGGSYGGGNGAQEPAAALSPEMEITYDLRVLERLTIERALRATSGHRSKAARLLGISERTLRNKLNVGDPEEK